MPNFKKLAKGYETNATIALQELVRIDSVYDASSIKTLAPYGDGVKKALDYVGKLGIDYGFGVDHCGGYCTELSYGEAGPLIGIFAHCDVVPISGVWATPAFGAVIKDGRMWGRGTADDKGPLIAAFYAIKLLKDNGLLKGFRVRLVAGGDEERGSSCLRHYFESMKKEEPSFGFTPDSEFPLTYAEKGMRGLQAVKLCDLSPIINIEAGVVTNAVADKCVVTMKKDPKFEAYFKQAKIDGDLSAEESIDIVTFRGKTAHGSTPEKGVNAALIAFKILGDFYKIELLSNLAAVLADPNGQGFQGYQESPILGKTTYNYGIVKYDGRALKISVDFRFGETAKPDELVMAFEAATKMNAAKISEAQILLYDTKSPLVKTLMKAYRRETLDLFAKPMTAGGGTYAKEAANTVAFGAAFKGHDGAMHSPNEYIFMDDFHKQIAIYARAIYMLGRIKK